MTNRMPTSPHRPALRHQPAWRGRKGGVSWLALALLAAMPQFSCKEGNEPLAQTPNRGHIGFVGASVDDPLWGVLRSTAERYPEAMAGFKLILAAPAKRSAIAQIEILRKMHTSELRGICIQPAADKETDAVMLRDELVNLRATGVAVVTMLTRLDTTTPFLHAGLDEMAIGAAMAEAIAEAIDGTGTIAVLHDRGTLERHTDRYVGFRDRCDRLPGLTVLREFDCDNDASTATKMMREYMERYPRLQGWVSIGAWPIQNLGRDERLLPDTCKLVTYGPFPRYWPLISEDICYAMIGAEYDEVAAAARRMCVAAARGESASTSTFFARPVTITARNLDLFKQTWSTWSTPATPVPPRSPTGGELP